MNKQELEKLIGNLFSAYTGEKLIAHIDGIAGKNIVLMRGKQEFGEFVLERRQWRFLNAFQASFKAMGIEALRKGKQ